jgi:hypothetical protein
MSGRSWVDELASFKAVSRRTASRDYVFATATGARDTRGNAAKRLRRAAERASVQLEADGLAPLPDGLTPHSLRRTFASLLYLRGEDPVYVMDQLGHSDPKLALRIYARAARQRRPGHRLVAVLDSVEWAVLGGRGVEAVEVSDVGGLPEHERTRHSGAFRDGPCWARTSDLRLVEPALSQLS